MSWRVIVAVLLFTTGAFASHTFAADTNPPADIYLNVGVAGCKNDTQCGSGETCGADGVCHTTTTGLGTGGTGTAGDGNFQTGLSNPSSSANGADTSLPNPSADFGSPVTGGAGGIGAPVTQTTGGSSDFTPLAPIPGLDAGISPTQAGMQTFLNNLYIFILGIAVILAILMIIWGGIEYALSEAITSKAAGKKKITNALYGLVLVLAPTIVFSIINPSILNLYVNFPPLNTQASTYTPSQNPTTQIQVGGDTAAQLQQAENACTAQGGTPVRWSDSYGNVNVTCNPASSQPPASSLISQSDCAKLSQGQVLQNRGYTCSTAPGSVTSAMQSGGYVCSDLQGGGICLHK